MEPAPRLTEVVQLHPVVPDGILYFLQARGGACASGEGFNFEQRHNLHFLLGHVKRNILTIESPLRRIISSEFALDDKRPVGVAARQGDVHFCLGLPVLHKFPYLVRAAQQLQRI